MILGIGSDKVHHCVYSYAITKALRTFLPMWAAAIVAAAIGIGKEVYDKTTGKGRAEWSDLAADAVGIALGCIG